MNFERNTVWKISYRDDYWINYCVEKLFDYDFYLYDALFLTRESAIDVIKAIFKEYHKEVAEPGIVTYSLPSKENRQKILEDIKSELWNKNEYRFSPITPSQILIDGNCVYLVRSIEMRGGISIPSKKTVVVDGFEYTRESKEERWSQWYETERGEKIYLGIEEHSQIIFK